MIGLAIAHKMWDPMGFVAEPKIDWPLRRETLSLLPVSWETSPIMIESDTTPPTPRIKLITCFSASHKALFDKMSASLPWEPGLELAVRYLEQDGDGSFRNDGWKRSTGRKIEFVVETLESLPDGSLILWVDVDIIFFRPVRDDLVRLMAEMRAEILFQSDKTELCAGFFIVRKTPKTMELFHEVLRVLPDHRDDQVALNSIIAASGVRFGLLPHRYYTIGLDNPVWNGVSPLKLPKTITTLHANFTIGIENKLKLIELVLAKMRPTTPLPENPEPSQ